MNLINRAKTVPVILGIIVLVSLLVRLPGLGSFMTVDEEKWMLRSGTYWHELFRQGDVSGTFVTTHPGATLTWLSGAGIFWQEARLGFDIDTSNLRHFRKAATLPVVIAVSLLIGLVTFLVARLFDIKVAIWTGLLLASEPYLVGMSQIAHVDMLLALFMLCSVLGWLLYLDQRRQRWLVMAGISFGLALATKLFPALWLGIFFVIVTAAQPDRRQIIRKWFYVVGLAVLVLYITWPALWVPNDLERYYQRDAVSITSVDHGLSELSDEPIASASFYGRTLLGRTTPFVLLIGLSVVLAGVRYGVTTAVFKHVVGRLASHGDRKNYSGVIPAHLLWWLTVYAGGFLAGITLVAKKADRYALPALVVLPILAALGWVVAQRILPCPGHGPCKYLRPWILAVVMLMLVVQPLGWAPYAIGYDSPFGDVRPTTQQGWGEGLDAAARWLNDHPLGEELTIASWYPGVMRTYFNGTTMSLSSRHDDRVGYLVTYRNMMGRRPDDIASNVLDEVRDLEPVHVVRLGGMDYVWIYEQLGLPYFPLNIGELVGDMEVGQIVPLEGVVDHIEIGMATFSSRNNTKDIVFQVRDSIDSTEIIREVVVNASDIVDSEWHRFEFEPILNRAGQTVYVSLHSPSSVTGDAVTVRFSEADIRPGQMLLRRRALKGTEASSEFIREGDLAYRI